MKLLLDSQLPQSITSCFKGYYVIHTYSLMDQHLTKDADIGQLSSLKKRAVITKDTDFFHSYMTVNEPYKLVLVKLGNMRIKDLKAYFKKNAGKIVELLEKNSLLILEKHRIRILK